MKKVFCIITIILLVFAGIGTNYAYATTATTEDEQLKNLEINSKTIFEDIAKLKAIIKAIYEKLSNVGKVDGELKDNIKEDIDKMDEIGSIEDSELDKIKGELNSKVDDLTDDNLAIMKSIIEDDKEFYDGILFTEQDYQELKQKYMQIIVSALADGTFSKKSDSLITVNSQTLKTTAYSCELNSLQVQNLVIKLLSELENDEIILSKVGN